MDFLPIISAVSAACSVIGAIISVKYNRFKAVNEFLSAVEDEKFIVAKKHVYNCECFGLEDTDAALVVNFFHHWGLLARKHYLPMWVFDSGTGSGACRLYERVSEYIVNRRKANNDLFYAEHYDWLYTKLQQRQ